MKTDNEIMELIGLGKPKKNYSKESKEAYELLTKQMIKIFKIGYNRWSFTNFCYVTICSINVAITSIFSN